MLFQLCLLRVEFEAAAAEVRLQGNVEQALEDEGLLAEEREQEQGVNSHGESPVVLDWPGDVAIRST